MTVKELMNALKDLPEDYEVTYHHCTVGDTVNLIDINKIEVDDIFGLIWLEN